MLLLAVTSSVSPPCMVLYRDAMAAAVTPFQFSLIFIDVSCCSMLLAL